jgi:hypothetical protein
LFVLLILYTVADLGFWRPLTMRGIDYDKHWEAARALIEGRNPYLGPELWLRFNYPQAVAYAFCWLGLFSRATGEVVWKMTLLACLVGCWLIGWRYYRPPSEPKRMDGPLPLARAALQDLHFRQGAGRSWGLVSAFAVSTYFPVTSCLLLGNADPLNALLSVALGAALLAGAEAAAGVCLALLVLVKLMPLALLAPLIIWKRWRMLKAFGMALGLYGLLLLAGGRWGTEWFFFREVVPRIAAEWRFISISPIRLLAEVTGHGRAYADPRGFARIAFWGAGALSVAYLGLLAGLRRRGVAWPRGLEAAIVFFPILSPLLEVRHFAWILPLFLLQLRRWIEGDLPTPRAVSLLFGWILLDLSFHFGLVLTPISYLRCVHYGALPGYGIILALTLADAWFAKTPQPRSLMPKKERVPGCTPYPGSTP